MRFPIILILAGSLVAVGCNSSEEMSSMPGMTAEEHARMQAGGTQGEADSTGAMVRTMVHLTEQQERALGVVYTTVQLDSMARTIRTVGLIEAPEPNIADVTPKIDGFVEELFVDFTGESVRRGEPLLTLYSPMLVTAQEELLAAKRLAAQISEDAGEAGRNARAMLEAARRRLAYWDIAAAQVERVERTGEVRKTLALVAPVTGIVLEKHVVEGQRVTPGMHLYRLADLTEMWVEGEVFEQDLQFVRPGAQAHIEVAAYPGEHLMGLVSFVYPTVDERGRTNRVRVTVRNRDLRLKPGMYATIYFDVLIGRELLAVPVDAVVVTGERNLVFIRDAEGMLAPREVVLGTRSGDRVQILAGLTEGETIVASANFLIDAESRLAATGGSMPGMSHAGHGAAVEPDTTEMEHPHD
jgi:Cu(I)/Ag(I) efflux system membrane fusion protein